MSINFKQLFSKQNLLNNLSLKIIALIVAVVLWFVVVGITDPTVTSTYRNVQVRLVNTSVVTGNEQTLEILEDSNILTSVTVKAPRSVIRELGTSSDNIIAIADLSNLSSDKTRIPIDLSTLKYNDKVESIKGSSDSVLVNIEKRETIQLPLVATTSGTIESGYVVGNVTPAQNQVKISGPASAISKVKKAAINVEITGFTENISTVADVVLYESDGTEVSQHNLELNADSIRVNVEILATKRVPIEFEIMGTPAEGYSATGEVECYPETMVVAGSKSEIAKLTSIKVPASDLNITGQTGNLNAMLNAADYLSESIRLVDSIYNGRINITVFVEKLVEQTYATYISNVVAEYVPLGFAAEIISEDDSVSFTLSGLSKDLEKVQMSQLNMHVNLEDYALSKNIEEFTEGTYKLPLLMDLPEGVELTERVILKIKLSKVKDAD